MITRSKLSLTDEQRFLLENLYRNFVRNGALLSPAQQDTLKKYNQEISVLSVKFSQNVLSETNKFKLTSTMNLSSKGCPGISGKALPKQPEAGDKGKWVFTTQKPSMLPFLTYSENRELRKKLYDAYLTRGNHNDELDNKDVLLNIVKLRP